MMYFHTAKVHCVTQGQDKAQTETNVNDMTCDCGLGLVETVGRILHLGVRASYTQRSPPQPATLCRPQPGPTHQRAQQPALPQSTADTARNLVSQPNRRAIPSPPSQTAAAAPAATAVQCSRSQSQAVGIRAVTSKQGVVPREVAAAAAASMAAARAPPALPSSLIQPYNFPSCYTAAATAAAAAAQCSHSQSQVLGLRAVTHICPRPLPSLVPETAEKCLAFAPVVERSLRARGEVASTRE